MTEKLPGVFEARKKDGTIYYRASLTYKGKHISLGSYENKDEGTKAYELAHLILYSEEKELEVEDYKEEYPLPFEKWVVLLNLSKTGIYCRNPIYLKNKYFIYYLDKKTALKFDADDLFYYMSHKIMRRGGHLFVADFGMQVSLLSRYGIQPFAVPGKDYIYKNKDNTDYRYGNLEIINKYHGVTSCVKKGKTEYITRIHVRSTYIVGRYDTEELAAVAYNKAAEALRNIGLTKAFQENYLTELSAVEYKLLYQQIKFSRGFKKQLEKLKVN